jgi:hypothetical protein
MYNGQNVVISKEAAIEIEEAIKWVSALEKAVGKAVISGNTELAEDLFTQYEDAQLNIRMIMRLNNLPVPQLRARVKLPF